MRKQLLTIAGFAALAIAGVSGATFVNQAEAQSAQRAPVILILDQQQLVQQSKAGKTIPDQANSMKSSVEKELEAEADKLRKDLENFQKNSSLMSEEVRQKTGQDLQARRQYGLPQRVQIMEQALSGALQNAQGQILMESRPIIQEIIDKRGATVVLDRSTVLHAAPEINITAEVIAAVDKKFPKVEVQRVSLAEIEKQIKEAQAKAQNQNN